MKIKNSKLTRLLTIVALAAMFSLVATVPAMADTTKNETVYANLNYDGSVQSAYVVNLLSGEYLDYGNYLQIKNLSTDSEPLVQGDRIFFPDEDVPGGLYYQGTLDAANGDAQLPLLFEISYYLDGEPIDAVDLAGRDGKLRLDIDYLVNEDCPEQIREGLMAQITISLAMDKAININAPGANSFLVGNQANITYMALPGKSGIATLTADVTDFSLDPISISLMKLDLSGEIAESISEAEQGFDEMISGSNALVSGTIELKDGMLTLGEGAQELDDGMDELVEGGWDIGLAMQEYADNLAYYLDGVQALQTGSGQIKAGLDDLADQAPQVGGSISAIDDGLADLAASGDDLTVLANSLLTHSDPEVRALAEGTLEQTGGVNILSAGLTAADSGLDSYLAGVEQIASEYGGFDQGIIDLAAGADPLINGYNALYSGYAEYYLGIKEIGAGMAELNSAISGLPADVQKMVDGQIEFNQGLNDAKSEISQEAEGINNDDTPAVSFTSADKNDPQSVQYMMLTPKIAVDDDEPEQQVEEKKENFFTRLVDLFTRDK